MSPGSLIPDRQLTFSPDLAATIGLEEAVLLQGIGPRMSAEPRWCTLQIPALASEFPFWEEHRIRELLLHLADLGILSVLPSDDPNSLRVAPAGEVLQSPPSTAARPQVAAATVRSGTKDSPRWRPEPALLDLLTLNHGIDRRFALEQLAHFEPGEARSREARFRQCVLSAWRLQQANHPVFDISTPPPFDNNWQPSADAQDILHQGGVDNDFIDSVRAEFILYWRERGGPPKDVNSRFVAFVRQRWARYQSGLSHTREPQRLDRQWQPDPSVWDMLDMAGVDRGFARERLPEFVLYWVDSNELHTSWNSKFLQHIKHQWRRHQAGEQSNDREQDRGSAGANSRTRDRSLAQDLSDSSWAN